MKKNHMTAVCGVLTALAMILSFLESLIPMNLTVPGMKLGLANIVTIIAMQRLGAKPAFAISTLRVLMSGILFGNPAVIVYSLAGAYMSMVAMWLAGRIKLFTIVGVSVCGAVFHNLGQIIVAAMVMENIRIMYYMTVLAISGTASGVIIGLITSVVIKKININM